MARIFLKKTLSGLAASDDEAADYLRKHKIGDVLAADVVKPREHRSLKRYWVLVKLVQENSDQFPSRDALHQYFKLRAGHVDQIVSKTTGEIFLVPKSIDYATLDETAFMEVWSRIVDVVCQEILPGVEQADLEREIQKLCGLSS